jgi:hypothetical protein
MEIMKRLMLKVLLLNRRNRRNRIYLDDEKIFIP